MNVYSMRDMLHVSNIGIEKVTKFLEEKSETITVVNVEDDTAFRKMDIDLLWIYQKKGITHMKKIEVKSDRYSHTGNYFLETVSNLNKDTPGCFLYTEADYIFYYFIDINELNAIPVKPAREWFLKNEHRFVEKKLSTSVGQFKSYSSLGRLVPKKVLNHEVLGVMTKVI